MTKLGVQGGPEEEVKQDVVKDPKVFTVVQPTFVPIPIQTTEPMRKSVPSTWCLMARLLAIVLVGSLLFSLLVFAVWNKDEVARAITGEKSTIRTLSEPQFAALNSQVHAGEVEKKEEPKDDGAQITIKQTGEGTQMIIQMPKSDETKDGARTAENTPAIPMLQLVPARERSEEGSEQQVDSQEMMDGHRRPMHPYEMEGPSPDALNFGMHPMMALQAARAAQYENEMRAWRMRRLQQMLVLAAVQQAQQQAAALRYAYFQRQQWAAQQMVMQQAMEARRQAEWQEYWRRAAIARMMQQQAMQQMQQQQQQQQQPVASSWQAAEQPRPWFTQQQQPMMQWPQQQFFQQQQWQAQQQQQPMMQQHPFWMQQQQQPQFEPQGGAQVRPATPPTPWWRYLQPVPQSQPLFLFQQALQARLRDRMQMQHMQQLRQEAAQHDLQQHQEMPQMQQQSDEESQEQPQQPQPQPHAFIFIRRFFPIPQDSREQQPPQQSGSSSSSSEESNEKNIPLRPHDASAQQIVEQMRGGPNSLPDAPLPGIHDRIFQHFQTLSQQMQDRSGQSQAQSQPPLFASIPNSVEQQTDSQSQSQETHNYDQDAIYEKLQRQSMQLQHDGDAASVQTDSAAASASHSKEDDSSMVVDDDDHDIRRGDAVLGAFDRTAQIDSDITTTTEPVMIENFVRAQSEEKDDEDKLTPEEKRKVAQLDSAELKEAAALEASLEREANEQNEKKEAELVKVEEEIVHEANKDSSSTSEEKKESEEKEDEPVTLPAATTIDPLSEFFRFFEKEAVKLSAQDKQAERVVVDSETGTHSSPVVDELNDEENSSENETKPDEMPEELPSVDSSKDSEEVAASIDTAPVSNEAEIKVSQVANSREIGPITIAAAA
ncbi:hypothetical protein PRIPAC_92020 [Pristionchus pacificus]|uniref:Uncharacterized protein n=1 Tax=Pristionchus pacificus TaxID=54126 RepID=A0A2A6CDQ4_PRIPA|nr:hypothetical protein PRIPAC_92020 [Pristionchus pacificus]|eukprot:PDM76173.1 hypothetical protein PRIPAC_39777 [Pristionchus pacificus]